MISFTPILILFDNDILLNLIYITWFNLQNSSFITIIKSWVDLEDRKYDPLDFKNAKQSILNLKTLEVFSFRMIVACPRNCGKCSLASFRLLHPPKWGEIISKEARIVFLVKLITNSSDVFTNLFPQSCENIFWCIKIWIILQKIFNQRSCYYSMPHLDNKLIKIFIEIQRNLCTFHENCWWKNMKPGCAVGGVN